MRIAKAILTIGWYAVCGALFLIWVTTATRLGIVGVTSVLAIAFLIPLLFMVEGLELAVAALLGRRADAKGNAGKELNRIQTDRLFSFFPNRQVFVVASIVVLTVATSFDAIYVPKLGWTSDYLLTHIFNIGFATLMVLLLAQIPSKRLALLDPQRFFASTWMICVVVRWVGALKITEPAEAVVRLATRVFRYPASPHNAPPDFTLLYDPIDGWLVVSAGAGN